MGPRRCAPWAALATALSITLGATASLAQTRDENWKICAGPNSAARIPACTALIQSGSESNDNLAAAYINRGAAYNETDQNDRSVEDYDRSIRLNAPSAADAWYGRGHANSDRNQKDVAIQDYTRAIGMKPQANYFISRAILYLEKRQMDLGRQDLDQALRLEPNNAFAIENRGVAHHMAGRYDAAIADYNTALRLEPSKSFPLYGRGLARRSKGDQAGGDADIAAALVKRGDLAKWFALYGL